MDPESIAETRENPYLIVYSGKITLFMAFFDSSTTPARASRDFE